MASSSSSHVPSKKSHAPLNLMYTDDTRSRRSFSHQQNHNNTPRINPDVRRTPLPPLPPHFSHIWTPVLPLPPHRRNFSHSPPPPPPPSPQYRFSPRRDSSLPPRPPQHRRNYSPRRGSPPDYIRRGDSSSSFRSSGPSFSRRDSESEARRAMSVSHSRNYHHHERREGFNLYRERDERQIRRDSHELEPRRHWNYGSRNNYHGRPRQGSEGPNPYRQRGSERHEKRAVEEEAEVAGVKRPSKILIRIPCKKLKSAEDKPVEKKSAEKNPKEKKPTDERAAEKRPVDEKEEGEINEEDDDKAMEEGEIGEEGDKIEEMGEIRDEVVEEGEKNPRFDEEEVVRVWNLRPRQPIIKGNEAAIKSPTSTKNAMNKSQENKGNGGGDRKKKKVKVSLNVALTKHEIEEDFFAWSGAKPPRRPQKRAKNLQKLLDSLFPGLCLTGISIDSYKS